MASMVCMGRALNSWDSFPLAALTTAGIFGGMWLADLVVNTLEMPTSNDWCGLPAMVVLLTCGMGGGFVGAVGYTKVMGIDR